MCPNALIPYPAHLPETCDHRVVQYRLALIPSSEKMGLLKADFIHQVRGSNPAHPVDVALARCGLVTSEGFTTHELRVWRSVFCFLCGSCR